MVGFICQLGLIHLLHQSPSLFIITGIISLKKLFAIMACSWSMVLLIFMYFFHYFNENKLKLCFYSMLLVGVFAIIIAGYISRGEAIRSIVFNDKYDIFNDFFNSIRYGRHPYANGVIYPPLINVFYAIFGHFTKILNSGREVRTSQSGMLIFMLYTAIVYFGLIWAFFKLKLGKNGEKCIFIILTLLSLPFIYAFERGNSIIPTIFLILLYLKYYKSEKIKLKYLSFFSLAIASSIKISPAIFGFLLIKEKRYKDAIICALLGIIVFMMPFLLTDGNLSILLNNIVSTTLAFQGSVIGVNGFKILIGQGAYVNLLNTAKFLGRLFNRDFVNIASIGNIGLLLVGVFGVCMNENMEEWKTLGILSGLIILCTGFSAIYNLTYIIIPLIYFLNKAKYVKLDYIYMLLFVGMLIPIVNIKLGVFTIFFNDIYPMRISTFIESIALLLFVIFLVSDNALTGFYNRKLFGKQKKIYLTGMLVILIGVPAYVYGYKAKQPIQAFYPSNLDVVNAGRGFAIKEGLFGTVSSKAQVKLQTKEIKQNGMLLCFTKKAVSESDSKDIVELYANDKIVGQCKVKESNFIFVIPSILKQCGIDLEKKSLIVKIVYRCNSDKTNNGIDVSYLGPAKGLKEVKNNEYIDETTVGLYKNNGTLWLGKEAKVLLDSSNIVKEGLRIRGTVPSFWQLTDVGKLPVLTISTDQGTYNKTLPISGNFDIQLPSKQVCALDKVWDKHPTELRLSMNGAFNSKFIDLDSDDFPKSLIISYIGPDRLLNGLNIVDENNSEVEGKELSKSLLRPDFADCSVGFFKEGDNYWLSKKGIVRLESEKYKENGMYISYIAQQELFFENKGVQPEVMIYINGNLVVKEAIKKHNRYGNNLEGIFIPATEFKNCNRNFKLEIAINNTFNLYKQGYIHADFCDRSILLNYIGYNCFPTEIDDKTNLKGFASGVTYDDREKLFTMGKWAEILLATNNSDEHELKIKYDVSPFLFQANPEASLSFSLYINGKKIKKVNISKPGINEVTILRNELVPFIGTEDKFMTLKIVSSDIYNEKAMRIKKHSSDISLKILHISVN